MDKKTYWDKRFSQEGRIWGDDPSSSATYALKLFHRYSIKKVLVPGAGYGRNSRIFSEAGYKVIGVEISEVALNLARKFDPLTTFYNLSVLDIDTIDDSFDAIYCFNVLHLFKEKERKLLVQKCIDTLVKDGLLFFVVFSEKESNYGKGKEVEPNTFEGRPNRPVHYFTEDDLKAHFSQTTIIETGLLEDREKHVMGPHTHSLRYILCQK